MGDHSVHRQALSLADIRMFIRDRAPFVYRSSAGYVVTGWESSRPSDLSLLPYSGQASEDVLLAAMGEMVCGPVYVLVVAGQVVAFASGRGMVVADGVARPYRRYVNLLAGV